MFNRTAGGARWALASLAALAVVAVVSLGAIYATHAQVAHAATVFMVTNTNDSGAGSLRQAIADANSAPGPDTIRIPITGTVHLSSTLMITDDVTLLGPGADLFAVDGGRAVQVFGIHAQQAIFLPVRASLADLTVQNGNASANAGGGIWATGALTLTNVNVLNNQADIGGGALVDGIATLIGGRFENNTALNNGGGLYAHGTLNLTRTQFIGNNSGGGGIGGGGIVVEASAQVYGGRFENNHCNNASCVGGGLFAFGTLMVTDTLFIGNTATDDGGGAWADSSAQIYGGRFENNRCTQVGSCGGGGLGVGGRLTLAGTQFVGNSAGVQGGGLYVKGAAQVRSARFEQNRCEGQLCHGGGLGVQYTLQMSATEVVSNTAGGGGGVSVAGDATITGSRLVGNTAGLGGGLEVRSDLSLTATLTMTTTEVLSNTATTGSGGGLDFSGSTARITGSRFAGNTARQDGGGAYLRPGGFITAPPPLPTLPPLTRQDIIDTQFLDNHAQRGGGLFLHGYLDAGHTGAGSVENALFARNRAPAGAALYLGDAGHGGAYDMLHATIDSGVPVTATAIVVAGGSAGVQDTILANHATGIQRLAGTVGESANLFFHTGTPTAGGVTSTVVYPQGDPRFADAAQDDYHIGAGSAAIDKAIEQPAHPVVVDFEGETRPAGGGFDIGFDEYVPKTLSGLQIAVSPLPTTPLGTPTSFTATVRAGTTPITYTWGFGDGTPASTGTQVAHTYARVGQFTVRLTATNSLGHVSTTTLVTVLAAPPPLRQLYLPLVRR